MISIIKNIILTSSITLLSCHGPACLAQQSSGTKHFDSELDIFFDACKNTFKNKKVSLIYFIPVTDSFFIPASTLAHPDTIFYGIRKNGQLEFQILQKKLYWSDSVSFEGYDTIKTGINCRQRYYCDCESIDNYDSIVCDVSGRIKFIRQNTTFNKENDYSSDGLLKEQRIKDMSPDGSPVYKVLYRYDKYKRLISIDLLKGQASAKTKVPITDIFRDFEFPIVAKTIFSYNKKGLLSEFTSYWINKNNKIIPADRTTYIYSNDLLIRTEIYEFGSKEITYLEKVGYKFY